MTIRPNADGDRPGYDRSMIGFLTSRTYVDRALLAGATTSLGLLAGAHIFEAVGYIPCALCLDQREAHWAAAAITVAGLIASFAFSAKRVAAAAVGAAALVYLISAGLAFYHTGVEFEFWPGPASCSALGGGVSDVIDLAGALSEGPTGPSCTDAQWRLFGVSMAGYNVLASAGLFALCLFAAIDAARSAREERRKSVASPSAN